MAITNQIDIDKWRIELVNFLRANLTDIRTIDAVLTPRTTLTQNDTLVGDGGVTYALSKSNIGYVNSVTVAGAAQIEWTDYTIDYKSSPKSAVRNITFSAVVGVGVAIVVNYEYGNEYMVWGGRPQKTRDKEDYPYVIVDDFMITTEEGGLGGVADKSNVIYSIKIFDSSGDRINTITEELRQKIQENKKNFANFNYIHLKHSSPIIKPTGRQDSILMRTVDVEIPHHYELIT